MNQKQRLKEINEYLLHQSELTVTEACEIFKASPATIRRDFNLLIGKSEVKKTWGGIALTSAASQQGSMSPVSYRQTLFAEEKSKIAEKAASYVKDGDIVIIDGGTTTFFMGKFLSQKKIRVITNSILIAHQIDKGRNKNSEAEVFVTGGMMYPNSGLLVGPQSIANIKQYNATWAFLSVEGISGDQATNSNQLVVETERAIIEQCENVVMLADHSKFGKVSMSRICAIEEIDILITDHHPGNRELISEISEKGVEVVEVV
ncbi:MAG: DeoR/GlpR family DNA-binding transcription regulator [Mucilaginibacter sp.]